MDARASDLRAIRDLINRQFASISWSAGGGPDTVTFGNDFLHGAPLYPSARPVSVRSVDEFTEYMGELVQTTLTSFQERVIGAKVIVFGEGHWKIAAQAWDKETNSVPIPAELLVDF
jgi:hypothetical protein